MRKKLGKPREIDLSQEGTVCLKLSDSRVLLSLERYPQENLRLIKAQSKVIDECQIELDSSSSSESQEDSKKIKNVRKEHNSFGVLQEPERDRKKRLKQALIHTLKELDEDDICVIRDSVLDQPSKSKKFSKKQPQMSIDLITHFYKFDRLDELTSYLEEFHQDIMILVNKKMN